MQRTLLPATRLAETAAAWDTLARAAAAPPFLHSRFLLPALRHFGSGREQLILLHDEHGPLAAALVQRGARFGAWETFQPSQLPLGALLLRPGTDVPAAAAALLRAVPGLCLRLGLTQLDPLFVPRPQPRACLATADYIDTAWVDIDTPFETYWAARGKNLRQNTRKQLNKLAAEGTATRLELVTRAADVPAALAHYGALESSGWKADTGTAVHPDNAQGRFYTEMLQAYCDAGHGRIYRYWFGDKVVAMDLCVDDGAVVTILKTSYDETLKTVSPSTLMRHDEFSALFAEGRFRRIEFYGKVMEWHTRWTDQRRTIYHCNADRWAWVPALRQRLLRPAPAAAPPAGPPEDTPTSAAP